MIQQQKKCFIRYGQIRPSDGLMGSTGHKRETKDAWLDTQYDIYWGIPKMVGMLLLLMLLLLMMMLKQLFKAIVQLPLA